MPTGRLLTSLDVRYKHIPWRAVNVKSQNLYHTLVGAQSCDFTESFPKVSGLYRPSRLAQLAASKVFALVCSVCGLLRGCSSFILLFNTLSYMYGRHYKHYNFNVCNLFKIFSIVTVQETGGTIIAAVTLSKARRFKASHPRHTVRTCRIH